jgi:hypothetical protein
METNQDDASQQVPDEATTTKPEQNDKINNLVCQ